MGSPFYRQLRLNLSAQPGRRRFLPRKARLPRNRFMDSSGIGVVCKIAFQKLRGRGGGVLFRAAGQVRLFRPERLRCFYCSKPGKNMLQ